MDVKKRVKVYQLDSSGKWEDKGTGHVHCLYLDSVGGQGLMVRSEDTGATILETKIFSEDTYQRQQETLIVWTDPTTSADLALSFQETEGCQEIWSLILNYSLQRQEEFEFIELPNPLLENLESIRNALEPSSHPSHLHKEKIVNFIVKEDYISLLLDLFEQNEKSATLEELHQIFNIFKNLILFNDTSIFEVILSDENILKVMGTLEYDPDISDQNRIKHREFLNHHVIFKEIIKFSSENLLALIHQTFRIQYLKDVVLPRVLDDLTFATFNSIIYFNNTEIVNQIQKDGDFLQKILIQIQSSQPNSSERRDSLVFLQELCGIAKGLQVQNKLHFFSTMSSLELFKTLAITLNDENIQSRISTTEILIAIITHEPRILRNYIVSNNSPFLSQLISTFINDRDIGVKNQIVEIIKVLLETEPNEMNDFFKLFYEKGIYDLVVPLSITNNHHQNNENNENNNNNQNNNNNNIIGEPTVPGDPSSNLDSFVLSNVIELIIYCIKHHSFRIRHFITQENIANKILNLTRCNSEKYIVLGAVRFFRCLVSMKEPLYNEHIIQDNLFDPIIEIFKENIDKYNLLNSAILELLDFIYKESIRELVIYLVERYKELFESINYTTVLKQLVLKYEQLKDSYESPEITNSCNSTNINRNERELDDEEEAYFRDDSDDSDECEQLSLINNNNEGPIKANSNILEASNYIPTKVVAYDDDDDDEEDDEIQHPPLLQEDKEKQIVLNNNQEQQVEEEKHDSNNSQENPDTPICNGNHKDQPSTVDQIIKEEKILKRKYGENGDPIITTDNNNIITTTNTITTPTTPETEIKQEVEERAEEEEEKEKLNGSPKNLNGKGNHIKDNNNIEKECIQIDKNNNNSQENNSTSSSNEDNENITEKGSLERTTKKLRTMKEQLHQETLNSGIPNAVGETTSQES